MLCSIAAEREGKVDYYNYIINEIERTGGEYRYPIVVGSISGIMQRSDLSNNEKVENNGFLKLYIMQRYLIAAVVCMEI